jgi:PPK2 family polyphosphate:nucleotide phosphotransferase
MARERTKIQQFRAASGSAFRLADHDPAWLPPQADDLTKKERRAAAEELLASDQSALEAMQDTLYADDRYALLLIFQAMDAAGKDGTIRHVMSGINPQGCQVTSFKVPSAEELDHDFLWRTTRALPERGRIGIFNRSYYEEVLVVKVHPEILGGQRIPGAEPTKKFWAQRYESINAFEHHLVENGTVVLKFFLNVSKEAQKKRFLERIDDPTKNWKFSSGDIRERGYWDDYMAAYEQAIQATSTEHAPWWVIPADRKYVARAAVASIIADTISKLPISYPVLPDDERAKLADAKAALLAEQ